MVVRERLTIYYRAMLERLGESRWWPGDSPFEVAVGAILVQNTAWGNVEKAMARLKASCSLTPRSVWRLSDDTLRECLRPSGFFRLKAERLRALLECFARTAGDNEPPDDPTLGFLAGIDDEAMRRTLLQVKGVGQETADSILLYALNRPSFTADAYTRRIFGRHGLLPENASYEVMREFFMEHLPVDTKLFNEYHALIVRTGHTWCKKRNPLCDDCPLGAYREEGR
jgi:endonuclease-3 related protein